MSRLVRDIRPATYGLVDGRSVSAATLVPSLLLHLGADLGHGEPAFGLGHGACLDALVHDGLGGGDFLSLGGRRPAGSQERQGDNNQNSHVLSLAPAGGYH